jgi:hypothetical protein
MIKKMIQTMLLCFSILLAALAGGGGIPAFALADGAYLVSNNTYYVNPDTGVADDGGDTSTGEAMCRNTVYANCLYEQKNGKHYMTMRLKMRSFIKDIKFNVQQTKGDSSSYRQVSYEVVGANQEENTEDFRFELPAPDVLVNPAFFVGPMNRDVTFFMGLNMGSAKKDDGSFAAFNGTPATGSPQPEPEQTAPSAPAGEPDGPGDSPSPEPEPNDAGTPEDPAAQAPDGSPDASRTDGAEEEVQGIVEFGAPAADDAGENQEGASLPSFLLIGLAVVVCLGAGGYFVYRQRTKK